MAAVSVATGPMNSLLGKLGDEYKLLMGVPKEIEFLKRELILMNTLLQTLAYREKLDPLEKDWRDSVRELSYDIEDCIDLFIHNLGRGDPEATGDAPDRQTDWLKKLQAVFIGKTTNWLEKLWQQRQIAGQIQDLKARVEEESQRRHRYKLDDGISRPCPVAIDPRVPALCAETKGLVGTDGPREKIIGWLMAEEEGRKVVSIVGCGGLGKTTLAMEVFHKIGGDFHCRVSVSVSRTLNLKKLLKDMLFQINRSEHGNSEMWEMEQLIPVLRQCLKDKRYLIIIDDIWSKEAWERVKSAIPENNNQSRIITTTRITHVAQACCSDSSDHIYKMVFLDDDNSQMLFFKRIFPLDSKCPPHLEEVSNRILKKCGGLPLAIITIASLLATNAQSNDGCLRNDEWERVHDSIGSPLENDNERMTNILFLSYCDLPYHMRSCFLYLSTYPEDHLIEKRNLIWRWIAEGFITKHGRQRLDQIAESYFNELINRSMIQPLYVLHGTAHACRVHDIVRELIISLARGENFVTILEEYGCNDLPNKIRRLSLQSCYTEDKVILATRTSKSHVRSLSFFGSIKQMPCLSGFNALRVLDFERCVWLENHHIKKIGSLFQLRHLRFHQTKISELPAEIGNLQYLETLDIRGSDFIFYLPSTISQLRKLVRLLVPSHVTLPDDIGNMQSLEQLSYAATCNSIKFVQQLAMLTKMRALRINCCKFVEKFDDKERHKKILMSSLGELCRGNLQSLNICWDDSSLDILVDSLSHLKKLYIFNILNRVPRRMTSLVELVELHIQIEKMEEQDLHIIKGIPNLLYLTIVLVNPPKERLIISNHGWQHLVEVDFQFSRGGMGVMFVAGAMSKLQKLHLCFNVREIMSKYGGVYSGIEHLSCLRHLSVYIYCQEATNDEVESMETVIRHEATLHPNRPTLKIDRFNQYYIKESRIREERKREREEKEKKEEEEKEEEEEEEEEEEKTNRVAETIGVHGSSRWFADDICNR